MSESRYLLVYSSRLSDALKHRLALFPQHLMAASLDSLIGILLVGPLVGLSCVLVLEVQDQREAAALEGLGEYFLGKTPVIFLPRDEEALRVRALGLRPKFIASAQDPESEFGEVVGRLLRMEAASQAHSAAETAFDPKTFPSAGRRTS